MAEPKALTVAEIPVEEAELFQPSLDEIAQGKKICFQSYRIDRDTSLKSKNGLKVRKLCVFSIGMKFIYFQEDILCPRLGAE